MMKYTTTAASNSQPQPHRHRAHTINNATRTAIVTHNNNKDDKNKSPAVNLCGYDSYLHATICAGNGHHGMTGGVIMSSPNNTVGVATPIRKKCNQKLIKSRLRHQQLLAQQQMNHHHHQSPSQFHQSLSQHQKLIIPSGQELLSSSKHARSGRKHHQQQQQQQQVYHQRSLLMRRSKSKEELVTREKLNIVEGLLQAESFIDKLKITEDFAERHVQVQGEELMSFNKKKTNNNNCKPTELILEYGSVPVTAEPGECERLLAPTPSDEVLTVISNNNSNVNNNNNELFIHEKLSPTHSAKTTTTTTTPKNTALHRFGGDTHVHTHIHHHYHHFENEDNVV